MGSSQKRRISKLSSMILVRSSTFKLLNKKEFNPLLFLMAEKSAWDLSLKNSSYLSITIAMDIKNTTRILN